MSDARALHARTPGGLTLGTVRGISLRIDSSWLLIFFVVAWSAAAYFPRALPGQVTPGASMVFGLIASAVLFASIVAHELSHSLVARALGYEVRAITLFIFGGVSEIEGEPRTAAHEGAIAIAGPILSLVVAGGLRAACLLLEPSTITYALLAYISAANFAIAVFNLLPGFPLDGGRVLRAIFRAVGDSLVVATRKAALAGRVLGFAFMALGLVTFLLGGWMGGAWMGLIGWFLKTSADSGYRQVAFRAQAEGLRVGEVAERLVPLAPDASVLSALRQHGLYAGANARYPVAEGGRLLGMVSTERLRAVPRERWAEVRVGELLDEGPSAAVAPDETLLHALDVMSTTDRTEVAVADHDGGYWGVLRLDDVARIARTPEVVAA